MNQQLRRFTVALALLLAAGCARGFVAQRPYPAPDGAQLLAALRQRQQAVRGADLDTRTTSWLGGQRTRSTVLMLIDRAGRLRFEAEVALQGNVATLVTDGTTFSLLDLQANVFKSGPACAENIASLIPIALRPAEIAALLLGDAPLAADARVVAVTWDGSKAADVIEIENRGGRTVADRVWVGLRPAPDGKSWDVVSVELPSPGHSGRWRISFEDLTRIGGVAHANSIRIAEPGRSFDDGVEVKVKDRRLNPAWLPQAFSLIAPEGFPIQTVPCCPGCPIPKP